MTESLIIDTKTVEEKIRLYKNKKMLSKQRTLSCFDDIFEKMSTSQMQLSDYFRLNKDKNESKKSLLEELKHLLGPNLSEPMKDTVIYYLKRKIDPTQETSERAGSSQKFESFVKVLEENTQEAKRDLAKLDLNLGDLDRELQQQSTLLNELNTLKENINLFKSSKETVVEEINEQKHSCDNLRKAIELKEDEISYLKGKGAALKDVIGEELFDCMNKVKASFDKFDFIEEKDVSDNVIDIEKEIEKCNMESKEFDLNKYSDFKKFVEGLEKENMIVVTEKVAELKKNKKEQKKIYAEQIEDYEKKIQSLRELINEAEKEKGEIDSSKEKLREKAKYFSELKAECSKLVKDNEDLYMESKKVSDKYIEWIKKIHSKMGTSNSLMAPKDPNKAKRGSKFLSYLGLGGSNEKK